MSNRLPISTRRARRRAFPTCATVALALACALALPSCRNATRAAGHRTRPLPTSWSRPVTGSPSDLAADAGGAVVLSGGTTATALDPGGRVSWTRAVDGAGVNLDPPALDRDRVAVGASDRLVVLDRARGSVRWRADVPAEVGVVAFAHPHGGEDLVVSSTYAGDLEARAAADGAPRWSVREAGEVRARLALGSDERTVVAVWSLSGASVLRALDVSTGQVLWERTLGSDTSAPVVVGGLVLVGAGDGDYHAALESFGLDDGAPGWQVTVPASFEPELEPAAGGDDVVAIGQLGTVTAVDAGRGVERWHTDLGEAVLRARIVLGSRAVVVNTAAGAVVWLDRESGAILRRLTPPAGYPTAIAGRSGRLLVALRRSVPGRVVAYPW